METGNGRRPSMDVVATLVDAGDGTKASRYPPVAPVFNKAGLTDASQSRNQERAETGHITMRKVILAR
jgi:hypothetical protein